MFPCWMWCSELSDNSKNNIDKIPFLVYDVFTVSGWIGRFYARLLST